MNKVKFATAFALLCISAGLVFGQDVESPVRIGTQLVSASVSVKDANGNPVKGLDVAQFKIFDDDARQTIEYFSKADAGVTFGVVYDMHPTTAEHTRVVLDSLRDFAKGLPGADDFFLVMFNDRGSLTTEIVPDLAQVGRHLANPTAREPRSLYDAIHVAKDKLSHGKNIKRTLIVITDSADHNSRHNASEIVSELRTSDMRVYAIVPYQNVESFYGYEDLSAAQEARLWSDASPADRSALNSMTIRSGGTTFPTSLRREASIAKILQVISGDLHDQYVFGFYPTSVGNGKWHEIKIKLDAGRAGKGFVLTYRPGYQSGEPRR